MCTSKRLPTDGRCANTFVCTCEQCHGKLAIPSHMYIKMCHTPDLGIGVHIQYMWKVSQWTSYSFPRCTWNCVMHLIWEVVLESSASHTAVTPPISNTTWCHSAACVNQSVLSQLHHICMLFAAMLCMQGVRTPMCKLVCVHVYYRVLQKKCVDILNVCVYVCVCIFTLLLSAKMSACTCMLNLHEG